MEEDLRKLQDGRLVIRTDTSLSSLRQTAVSELSAVDGAIQSFMGKLISLSNFFP